ncbi:MAG: cytochrome c, partial [Verrucomicrobiota bacterium]
MDWQAKYLPQGENDFFPDGRNDRPVIPGTAGRGYGWEIKEVFSADYEDAVSQNPSLYSGKEDNGD